MAISGSEPDFITKAIEIAVKNEINHIINEETQAVQDIITDKIRGAVDRIALSVMDRYVIEQNSQEILIRVKKEL